MTRLAKSLAVAAVLAGCNDYSRYVPPPVDRFAFPVGMAVHHSLDGCGLGPTCSTCAGGSAGCRTRLYVASSNFQLAYDPDTGGTVVAIDPDQQGHLQPLAPVGSPVQIGSFAGELAILDQATCPGWEDGTRQPLALVPSRSLNRLYALSIGSDGSAACGPACEVPLSIDLGDPFGVTLSCPPGRPQDAAAWVSYEDAPLQQAWMTQVPIHPPTALDPLVSTAPFTLGGAVVYATAYDPVRNRLFLSSRFFGSGFVPIRYVDLGFLGGNPNPIRLDWSVAGAETTGIAISSDGTRAYVGLRLYEPDLGVIFRPPDIGGALAVLDITDAQGGGVSGRLLGLEPLGLGPSEVRVVPRAGLRDLVAVTCSVDSSLYLYDDEVGHVAKVIGPDPGTGAPLLGRQAFGLAVESPYQSAASPDGVRLFVASFEESFISTVRLDDPARPSEAGLVELYDPARPGCPAASACPALAETCSGTPCCHGATCPGAPACAACLVPFRIGIAP